MGDQTPESADTMGERGGGSRVVLWLLLDADRWAVTAVLSAGLWLAVVAVGAAHPTPARVLLSRGDPSRPSTRRWSRRRSPPSRWC